MANGNHFSLMALSFSARAPNNCTGVLSALQGNQQNKKYFNNVSDQLPAAVNQQVQSNWDQAQGLEGLALGPATEQPPDMEPVFPAGFLDPHDPDGGLPAVTGVMQTMNVVLGTYIHINGGDDDKGSGGAVAAVISSEEFNRLSEKIVSILNNTSGVAVIQQQVPFGG